MEFPPVCQVCKKTLTKFDEPAYRDDHCTIVTDQVRLFVDSIPDDICYLCWTTTVDLSYEDHRARVYACLKFFFSQTCHLKKLYS